MDTGANLESDRREKKISAPTFEIMREMLKYGGDTHRVVE